MAERTRFERVRPCGPTAFKAVAIIRSATSPQQRRRGGSNSHACYRARPPTECPTIRRRLPGAGYRTRTPVDGLASPCLAARPIPRSGPWESNPSGAAWKAAASPLGQTRDPSVVIGRIRSPPLSCVCLHLTALWLTASWHRPGPLPVCRGRGSSPPLAPGPAWLRTVGFRSALLAPRRGVEPRLQA
jgi:hypothetical protein